jgi:hypothetical protein
MVAFCMARQVMLVSTKAGAVGINLTSAQRMVVFDVSGKSCRGLPAVGFKVLGNWICSVTICYGTIM